MPSEIRAGSTKRWPTTGALRRKPRFPTAHFNLGLTLQDLGRLDEALARVREALRLKPDFAEAYNTLGSIYRNQGNLDEAMATYRQALRCRPDYAEALNNLGDALQDQGKLDEATQCQRRPCDSCRTMPMLISIWRRSCCARQLRGGLAGICLALAVQGLHVG